MREAGEPVTQGHGHFGVRGVGVSRGNDDSRLDEFSNDLRCRHFRRQGHQGPATLEGSEQAEPAGIELAELCRIVHTLALYIEEWALDVNAENPGHAGFDCALNRGNRARDDVEIRADESWQKTRGAESAVRATDPAYDCDGWCG